MPALQKIATKKTFLRKNFLIFRQNLHLNDRSYKFFYIADNCDKILNGKQREFLRLVAGRKPSDEFSRKIARLAEDAKHNTQWKKQYMEWERQRTYDFESGKEAGAQQKAVEAATNLLKMKILSPEQIANAEDLPLEKVLELQKEITEAAGRKH